MCYIGYKFCTCVDIDWVRGRCMESLLPLYLLLFIAASGIPGVTRDGAEGLCSCTWSVGV